MPSILCVTAHNSSFLLAMTVSEGVSTSKPVKQQPAQKKDAPPPASSIAASDRKGGERSMEKERRKDIPAPRMQFDDRSRVEKAKKRAVVNQSEARNRVELFRHLPQYEHGTQLPDLESKFFQLDPMHPAVYKVLLLLDNDFIHLCRNLFKPLPHKSLSMLNQFLSRFLN